MTNNKQSGFGVAIVIIVTIVVLAILGYIGYRIYTSQTNKPASTNNTTDNQTNGNTQSSNQGTNTQTSNQNIFKISELGVEFTVKDGITPIYQYSAGNLTWNGINYQNVPLSTQQLVDKGALEANGGNNACSFSGGSNSSFILNDLQVFNSVTDALTFLKATSNNNLTASDMTPANGIFSIGGKVFSVQQGVFGGPCLHDSSFETQQWQSLHDSLMTLKAIQ